MFDFIKNIFSPKEGSRRVVIIDESGTKSTGSYQLNPFFLWMISIAAVIVVIGVVTVLYRFTPLGDFISEREELRESVIEIQQKVASLQDTLQARNMQLNQMQKIMLTGEDTTLQLSGKDTASSGRNFLQSLVSYDVKRLPADAVLISTLFEEAPQFPGPFPIEGTSTRTFNPDVGHFGLDIAAPAGTSFQAVADGIIISQGWTFNYGFVIVIQHSEGIVTIYKHAQSVNKSVGEVVRQGDILGEVGNVGVLSSGPHLHIEIWEKGIPQNPQQYLIQP